MGTSVGSDPAQLTRVKETTWSGTNTAGMDRRARRTVCSAVLSTRVTLLSGFKNAPSTFFFMCWLTFGQNAFRSPVTQVWMLWVCAETRCLGLEGRCDMSGKTVSSLAANRTCLLNVLAPHPKQWLLNSSTTTYPRLPPVHKPWSRAIDLGLLDTIHSLAEVSSWNTLRAVRDHPVVTTATQTSPSPSKGTWEEVLSSSNSWWNHPWTPRGTGPSRTGTSHVVPVSACAVGSLMSLLVSTTWEVSPWSTSRSSGGGTSGSPFPLQSCGAHPPAGRSAGHVQLVPCPMLHKFQHY
mmetsp:Transcript_62056/g.142847  ORF Transcript_62056/g.142847 Transcript_62056/m.142847 type:complete len:294 (-) Transcript_62056:13-894(-)